MRGTRIVAAILIGSAAIAPGLIVGGSHAGAAAPAAPQERMYDGGTATLDDYMLDGASSPSIEYMSND